MMWGYGGMGWGGVLMTVSALLFVGLIVYGVVALVRYLDRGARDTGGRSGPVGSGAEQVLANRYAAGEIDEPEYHHRLEILREDTEPRPGK